MRSRIGAIPAIVFISVAALLAACAPGAPPAPAKPQAAAGTSAASSAASSAPSSPAAPLRGRDAYPAPSDEPVKLRAAWCAVAGAMFPLWIAKDAGIFERHRLDVDIQLIQGGDAFVAALMRGEIDFLECAGGGVIPAFMAGADGVFLANLYRGNPYRLIVKPEIQQMSDLRGKRLAISRAGDYDNRLTDIMLERNGLVPNQDVTLVPVGSQTDRYNALKGGMVDGTSVNPPVNLTAQNEGFREIFNYGDLNVSTVYISLYTMRHTLQQRPRVVERFLAAMIEAMAYARAEREYTIQIMGEYLKLTDRRALEGAYDAFAGEMMAFPPVVPIDAVQNVIAETLTVNPTAPNRDAATMVDMRPLQAVEASGFIDAVVSRQ